MINFSRHKYKQKSKSKKYAKLVKQFKNKYIIKRCKAKGSLKQGINNHYSVLKFYLQ